MTIDEMMARSDEFIIEDLRDYESGVIVGYRTVCEQWQMTAEICKRLDALAELTRLDQLPSRTRDEPK